MVGRIRVSKTFAAGQRSEMGQYEDPWEASARFRYRDD